MLEVVCQTSCFRRVVLSSYLYSNVSLDARLFLIYRHIHFHAVVKSIYLGFKRVAFHSLIFVL